MRKLHQIESDLKLSKSYEEARQKASSLYSLRKTTEEAKLIKKIEVEYQLFSKKQELSLFIKSSSEFKQYYSNHTYDETIDFLKDIFNMEKEDVKQILKQNWYISTEDKFCMWFTPLVIFLWIYTNFYLKLGIELSFPSDFFLILARIILSVLSGVMLGWFIPWFYGVVCGSKG